MCKYWKKIYLCGCYSHIFRERCRAALRDPNDQCADRDVEETPRRSFFKCFDCLALEAREDKVAEERKAVEAEVQRRKDEDRVRKESLRRESEERARREREEDIRRERDRKAEIERARREGAAWVESGARDGRKKTRRGGERGVAGVSNGGTANGGRTAGVLAIAPPAPGPGNRDSVETSAPLAGITNAIGKLDGGPGKTSSPFQPSPDVGVNGNPAGTVKGTLKENVAKSGIDPGGRAGTWGPKAPPTILKKPY